MSPLSELQAFTLFANLGENKSYINIPNKFIKMAASSLASPITKNYDESIETGIFKISRITPVYKSGSDCVPGNYRLIAIISSF